MLISNSRYSIPALVQSKPIPEPAISQLPTPAENPDTATLSKSNLVSKLNKQDANLELESAINRAQDHLMSLQGPDGSWSAENDLGHHQSAQRAILYKKLDRLGPQDAQETDKFLRSRQLEDGSWPAFPHSKEGDIDATAIAYAGMLATGSDPKDPSMMSAKSWIDKNGGFDNTRIDIKLFLSAQELVDKKSIPSFPKFVRLVPGLDNLTGKFLAMQTQVVMNAMMPVASFIKRDFEELDSWRFLQKAEHKKFTENLTQTQNPNGSWMGSTLHTLLGATALLSAGVKDTDDRVVRAFDFVDSKVKATEDGAMTLPFSSEVWDTASATQALIEAGTDPKDPRIQSAVKYMKSQQADLPSPKSWQNPRPGAPTEGGWAFMADNPLAPDTDTSGVVLSALAMTDSHDPATQLGHDWLSGMQLADGGWATWTAQSLRPNRPGPDKPTLPSILTKIPAFKRLNPILDDTSADGLTGRILSTMGHFGHTIEEPEIQKAVEFLKEQRTEDGIWWGRWGINYLCGTAFAVTGLAAVGQDMKEPWVNKAVDWLKSVQREDGGWGEMPSGYLNEESGHNPALSPEPGGGQKSLPSATSAVLMSLIDAGHGDSKEVKSGIDYLLKTQQKDGSWADNQVQGVGAPYLQFFYENKMFPKYWGLQALSRYKNHLENSDSRSRNG